MTDIEVIAQLRSFYGFKGWAVLREAADRLEQLTTNPEPACHACRDTSGGCNTCGRP